MKIRFRFKDAEIKLVPLFILEVHEGDEYGEPIGYIQGNDASNLKLVKDYHDASPVEDISEFLDYVSDNGEQVQPSEEYGDEMELEPEANLILIPRSIGKHDVSALLEDESEGVPTVKDVLTRSMLGDEIAVKDGAAINTFNELTYQLRQLLGGSYKDYKYGIVSTGNTMVIDPETNDRLLLLGPLAEPMKKKLERQNLLITTRIRDEDKAELIRSILEKHLDGTFKVEINGNAVTVKSEEYEPDQLWDAIERNNLFGEESNGWMTSMSKRGIVVLDLDKMKFEGDSTHDADISSEAIQTRVTELLNGRRTVPIHKMVSILWSEFGSADDDTIADAMIAANPEYRKDVILMYVDHMRGKGNSHKCKYCGDVVLNNNDPDILCEGCRERFGHTRYSEL